MGTSSGHASETSSPVGPIGAIASVGDRVHRWLAWTAWSLSLVAATAVASRLRDASVGEIAEAFGWVVGIMSVATLGALVVSKRRSLLQGWLLVTFSFFWSFGLFAYHLIALGSDNRASGLVIAHRLIAVGEVAYVLGIHALLLLLLLVPDGRLPSSRWKPMPWFLGASAVFFTWQSVLIAFRVVDVEAWLDRSTWLSNDGAALSATHEVIFGVGTVFGIVIMGLLARALWGRLQSASGEERQQVKWVLFACAGVLGWLLVWFPRPAGGWLVAVQELFPGLALVVLAVGFGMALFKYRLWDIDLVVRRSLVYGMLWLVIAGVYAGVAAGLGLAAGARFSVGVAIGLTVAATLIFQPARRWFEEIADRLVFGERDSPVNAIHSLGEGVAGSRRPQDIASELVRTVAAALGLARVAVEIDGSTRAEVGTVRDGPETLLPIAWGRERFGMLRCQPHRAETITTEDRALLEALAGQAALAMSHARLAARIVHAQEKERRRVERNIHDGAQQDLATLVAEIGVARAKAGSDPKVAETLDRIQRDAQHILVEIRELAQGIHPSVLRDGGLVAAIEDRCSRIPIEVNVKVGEGLADRRLPAEIEAAAYFLTTEAVANTIKHSGSSTVDVALDADGSSLRIEVRDAGVGFDPRCVSSGSGIVGLSDRVRALGGELIIRSEPGQGTAVTAELPVAPASEA